MTPRNAFQQKVGSLRGCNSSMVQKTSADESVREINGGENTRGKEGWLALSSTRRTCPPPCVNRMSARGHDRSSDKDTAVSAWHFFFFYDSRLVSPSLSLNKSMKHDSFFHFLKWNSYHERQKTDTSVMYLQLRILISSRLTWWTNKSRHTPALCEIPMWNWCHASQRSSRDN